MPQKLHSVIVCASHSFRDPLFYGLIYQYVSAVKQEDPRYLFHVFTEEQADYRMSDEEQKQVQAQLRKEGIHWHPIRYRNGRFILLKKLWNFIVMFWTMLMIRLRYRPQIIVGYLSIAGGYAYLASVFLRMKLLVMGFEPHSETMADFGIWSRNSLKYKVLKKVEYWEATRANYMAVPTIHSIKLLQEWKSKAKLFRVPTSTDVNSIYFQPLGRERIRQQYGMGNRYVLMYLGKFGGIYYHEKEVARFYKQLLDSDASLFFFIITPDNTNVVQTALLEAGLQPSDFVVLGRIPYEQLSDYISASDMGMIAIPPLPSQKYRSPAKTGNYLACGIPFLINRHIADDDILAETERVGWVVDDLSLEAIDRALPQLAFYQQEPREEQRERCRRVAIENRGIQNSVAVLHEVLREVYPPNN